MSSSVSYYTDEEIEQLLSQVPVELQTTQDFKTMRTNLLTKDLEKPKVGNQAPGFELESRTGGMVSMNDFEGKYKLLDFSNSGCGPCFMALPEIKEAYERYGSEVEVISIWNDKSKNIWLNSSKKHKDLITWTDLWDSDGYVHGLYQITILPSYILINPDGQIVEIWNSYRKGKLLRQMENSLGKS